MLAVIGGSSLRRLDGLTMLREECVETPFGSPSGPLIWGRFGKVDMVFIARHGPQNSIPPHLINYRANIWALKACGVRVILAVAAVGAIQLELAPGSIVIPDQIIDYTWGRESTFWTIGGPQLHIDFTNPYSDGWRHELLEVTSRLSISAFDQGVYAVTQGPRLESAAEIRKIAQDGGTLVGMTGMPEAALAREAGLAYATVAVVVNHAAGIGDSEAGISLGEMDRISRESSGTIAKIIGGVLIQ